MSISMVILALLAGICVLFLLVLTGFFVVGAVKKLVLAETLLTKLNRLADVHDQVEEVRDEIDAVAERLHVLEAEQSPVTDDVKPVESIPDREKQPVQASEPKPPAPTVKGKCADCAHFDLEYGQRQMQLNPIFMAAAQALTPNRMGKPVLTDNEGNRLPEDQQPKDPLPFREDNWAYFGACEKKHLLIHRTDTCEHFSPRASA